MDLSNNPLYYELQNIINSGPNPIKYEYKATLHTTASDIPLMKVISIDIVRDYVKNIGDDVRIEFIIALGDYVYDIYPHSSSTAPLSLDADGDGTVDATSSPNAPQTSDRYWDILKKICDSVGRHSPRSIALMKRMDHIRAAMKAMKGVKPVDFHREAASAGGYLAHLRFNRLSDADRDHVLDGIEGLVRQFE